MRRITLKGIDLSNHQICGFLSGKQAGVVNNGIQAASHGGPTDKGEMWGYVLAITVRMGVTAQCAIYKEIIGLVLHNTGL